MSNAHREAMALDSWSSTSTHFHLHKSTLDKAMLTAGPPYEEWTDDEIEEALEKHRRWLQGDEENGKRAYFYRADLSGFALDDCCLREAVLTKAKLSQANNADLKGANLIDVNVHEGSLKGAKLQGAQLHEAHLRECDLTEANLQGANLKDANAIEAVMDSVHLCPSQEYGTTSLQNTNLTKAKLRDANMDECLCIGACFDKAHLAEATLFDADLRDTSFEGAYGMSVSKVKGADVSGANLPNSISTFHGVRIVAETSKNARKLFLSMLLSCAYAILAVYGFSDQDVLLGQANVQLPIIGIEVPLKGFFAVVPLILFTLYTFLHLHIQRLWEQMGELPAVFRDGKPLDEKVYPWLMNGLVRGKLVRLKNRYRPALFGLQNVLYTSAAWATIPITIGLISIRYWSRHDWQITFLHTFLFFSASLAAFFFYESSSRALLRRKNPSTTSTGGKRKGTLWISFRSVATSKGTGWTTALLATTLLYCWGIFREITGEYLCLYVLLCLVLSLFIAMLARSGANNPLTLASLTSNGYSRVLFIYMLGAFLIAAAIGPSSHLVGAQLEEANLKDADLRGEDLRGAALEGADLSGADLRGVNLLGARGISANQLCQARNLSKLRIEQNLEDRLTEQCPDKFEASFP